MIKVVCSTKSPRPPLVPQSGAIGRGGGVASGRGATGAELHLQLGLQEHYNDSVPVIYAIHTHLHTPATLDPQVCMQHQVNTSVPLPLNQARSAVEAGLPADGVPRGLSYIFSWGFGASGALGHGDTRERPTPKVRNPV
jgi:hypothetical protein